MALWMYEDQTPGTRFGVQVRQTLHQEVTPYQELMVCETLEYGRMLVLDGVIQLTEFDEFVYHELIAQVPLHAHPNPEQVLIIGGGDGGSVREASKHPTVQKIVLAEIDERVIETSLRFFPTLSSTLRDNPKLELRVGDGIKFVKEHPDQFDVIIVDSSDPIGPGEGLFTHAFYEDVFKALKPGGIVSVQGESPWLHQALVQRIYNDLAAIFPVASIYWGNIPTYPSGTMVFPIACKGGTPHLPARQPVAEFKYYTSALHSAAFELPSFLRNMLAP